MKSVKKEVYIRENPYTENPYDSIWMDGRAYNIRRVLYRVANAIASGQIPS